MQFCLVIGQAREAFGIAYSFRDGGGIGRSHGNFLLPSPPLGAMIMLRMSRRFVWRTSSRPKFSRQE